VASVVNGSSTDTVKCRLPCPRIRCRPVSAICHSRSQVWSADAQCRFTVSAGLDLYRSGYFLVENCNIFVHARITRASEEPAPSSVMDSRKGSQEAGLSLF